MDRLRLPASVILATALLTSCGDDTTEVVEPLTERACSRPLAWGHWNEGGMHTIGPDRHVCLCMSEAEFLSGERLDELNAALLADCELAAAPWDFDWTECQDRYDEGVWIEGVTWPTERVIYPPGADLVCY